jgi:CRP-like cAMP-binding protein
MKTIDINQLTKYLLLKDISIKDVKIIQDNILLTNYKKNEIIIKENDKGKSILFLIDGDITISQALTLKTNDYDYNDNREKELIKVNSKNVSFTFGEVSLLNEDKKRTATVKANSECIIGRLNFDKLFDICEEDNKVGYQIMKNIAEIITNQIKMYLN